MRSLVDFAQAGGADVRVDLRRHQALVAEQFLHAADVGAAVEQVRGEAVSQRVRGGAPIQARLLQVLLQHPRHAARGEAVAELVEEQRAFGTLPARQGPRSHPAHDRSHRPAAQGRQSFAAPLAADAHQPAVEVQVVVVDRHQFTDAQSGRVRRFEHRAIAQPHRFVRRRGLEQLRDLVGREEMRQLAVGPRISQRLGGILLAEPFALRKPKEAPQCGQMARHRNSWRSRLGGAPTRTGADPAA